MSERSGIRLVFDPTPAHWQLRGVVLAAAIAGATIIVAPLAANEVDYPRFKTWQAAGWTVSDDGFERCDADFAVAGDTVLGLIGPYYFTPNQPAGGSIIHLGKKKGEYTLPKGNKEGEFPVELLAGDLAFTGSGFATDLGGVLAFDPRPGRTVIDVLAALPDRATLTTRVGGKQIYAIQLTGNVAAARALRGCTDFITAQKRPGTRNGPKLGPPRPPPPLPPEMKPDPPPDPGEPVPPMIPRDWRG